MENYELIGRLYVQVADEQKKLLQTIKALQLLKSGEYSLDQLEVTDTSWQLHPVEAEAPEPEPTPMFREV